MGKDAATTEKLQKTNLIKTLQLYYYQKMVKRKILAFELVSNEISLYKEAYLLSSFLNPLAKWRRFVVAEWLGTHRCQLASHLQPRINYILHSWHWTESTRSGIRSRLQVYMPRPCPWPSYEFKDREIMTETAFETSNIIHWKHLFY